ncbi:MAG: hypothetical protein AVDCRST_MAG93-9904 [uncultured Chloroflexia bacterium]|uniref:Uncharacterized protein n=1 Tax=uncultured Chloroflexia bacterium TaxID=1672391 RepID=A0A6J4NSF7_9CHLR|nr:MAG: hypothetical protein AVDCRST_MAG93-9904 [uncultured Chloroflexia bacterium]
MWLLAVLQAAEMKINETPKALELLADWSTWLVGLQTGALALITFIAGKEGFLKFTNWFARWLVYGAICSFALSTVFATIVLGQIPTSRPRMTDAWPQETRILPEGDFYEAAAWHEAPWVFSWAT